jgi:probable F420-dependent oxidoreductase
VKFGVNILNFGPEANLDSLRAWAVGAQSLGFHFAMISDHVAITPEVQKQYPAPFYDPFTVLAWLVGVVGIELGTTVTIVPYRHPLLTARLAANLDQLSSGRFLFGVGAGWAQHEFAALGIPFQRRGAITNEYLEVIRSCFTQDVVSYRGEFLSFDTVHTGPRPERRPHPPIWVGGSSEAALRRAVRYGDAWHPLRTRVSWLNEKAMPRLRELAKEEGKAVPRFCPRLKLRITDRELADHERTAGEGTLDQVRNDLRVMAALGAEYVLFDTYDDDPHAPQLDPGFRQLEQLVNEVIDVDRRIVL